MSTDKTESAPPHEAPAECRGFRFESTIGALRDQRFLKHGGTMRIKIASLALALSATLLAGCATNSGVLSIGNNTYLITRQAATGFSGLGNLAPASIREANRYCDSRGKVMHLIRLIESKPPYIWNYPTVEIRFSCDARSARARP